ncbi:hypothetical protein BEH_07125 [Priestia filamentosa]|uniref:Uncharacterized protein n=1 Tax=Priestia filamentosa TaxID=1402861 RepID=A0A0H4KUB9_9BACI|nr:hypothetical protein [Priestia filamentosa]AKO91893.1 hypothetical protein BEH_07125 [Priestia filamentosa]
MRIGSGYAGSENVTTSVANHEIVPPTPSNYVNVKRSFYKLSLTVLQDAHIKINGGAPILLKANQSFEMDRFDAVIYSLVIVEPNIEFQWMGAY